MKIVLTGGAGFIGSNMLDRLLANNHQVVVIDNLSAGKEEHLVQARKYQDTFTFYRMDIREKKIGEIMVTHKPEAVVHLAAQVSVRESVRDPAYDAGVNILGTLNLLQSCVENHVRKFIFASSGGAIYAEPKYLPVDEAHLKQPLSPYGISKKIIDDYLVYYNLQYGLRYTSLALSNVYGPRQDPYGEAGVVAIFIGQILRGETPTINGDGEQVRDFLYVNDAVEAFIIALEKANKGIYNIGTGVGVSVNRLYEMISELLSFKKEAKHGPPKSGEMRRIFLETAKARDELDWQATVSLEEGLRKTIEYFQKNLKK